jgi:uncharacterized Zn-finger protein
MSERNCKIICPDCGSRFDRSDLTLNFGQVESGVGYAQVITDMRMVTEKGIRH